MARVTFYDLPAQQRWTKIQLLAQAALRKGTPILVHCATDGVAMELDDWLWTSREDSFVPHEYVRPGQPLKDLEAKVVIVADELNPHACQVLVQEGPVRPEFAQTFASVIDFVDHRTPELLQASRQRYKRWREVDGIELDYRKEG